MSKWTHAICDPCYRALEGDREPVRVKGDSGYCCWCQSVTDGIFYRADPMSAQCGGNHA